MGDYAVNDTGHVTEHNRLRHVRVGPQWLGSFDGADSDAKLADALSKSAAATYPFPIGLEPAGYIFNDPITAFDGLRFVGPNGSIGNSELNSDNMPCKVDLSGVSGTWFNVGTGTAPMDMFIGGGICFTGGSGTVFMSGSAGLHCCHMRDVSFHQFKTVLGTQAQKLNLTACIIDGFFGIQGTYNGGIHIGGSDNSLFMGMLLIDCSYNYMNGLPTNANGQYHLWCDGLDNSHLGSLYITARSIMGALRVDGVAYNGGGPPSNLGRIDIDRLVAEGLNVTNAPAGDGACNGALVRVNGGNVTIKSGFIGRGMTNPTLMGHSPADAGMIHHEGGALHLRDVTFDRASGVDETTPMIYTNSEGPCLVNGITVGTKAGTWSAVPLLEQGGSFTGLLVHDATVRTS